MANRRSSVDTLLTTGREHVLHVVRSHRVRRAALIFAGVLLVFGLLGFLAAPPLIRSQLQTRLGHTLHRPVTLASVQFNPFTLKLGLDHLHIGDADGHSPFIDIDHTTINASWSSLFHMAPVLDELVLQHPQIHITRTAAQQFNFSDLIERFFSTPKAPNGPPARFSLSNISVHDCDIVFADKVLNTSHRIDQLELGIPFIANLPHDTDVFVQPLLALRVDGSPLRIHGQTKPFADSRESVLSFTLDHLDLPKYLGYVPTPLPVAIPRGQLSGQLELHFISAQPTPQLRLSGAVQLDNFALTGPDRAPLLELGHASTILADVEPLRSRYHLDAVQLDQPALHYTRMANGHSNLDALIGTSNVPDQPATPASTTATDLRIATLTLQDGQLDYTDRSTSKSAQIALNNLHGTLRGLSTVVAPDASVELAAQLASGNVGINGRLNLAASSYKGKLSLKGVTLAPLLPLAPPLLNADITHGSLDANGQLQASWGKGFNLKLAPATVAINHLALGQHGRTPIAWQALSSEISQLDLASSEARFGHVSMHGLKLDVQRLSDGSLDLTNLLKTDHSGHHQRATSPAWRWSIGHFDLDSSTLDFRDLPAQRNPSVRHKSARSVTIKADKFGIDGLSDNLHQSLKVDLTGAIGRGSYRIVGSVMPQPLDADLRVQTTRLDVASLQSLISVPLNVQITSALLSTRGHVRYREHQSQPLINYRGQLTLGQVRVQDKLTGDDFVRWQSLNASGMNVRIGAGVPQVAVAGLALSDFYARVIINANGRTNLQDVVTNPATAPVSVTQTQAPPVAPAPMPAPSVPATTSTMPGADIQIGQITLARGHLNYTDNFIKPNYTANITQLDGKVGAFGTAAGGPPAELTVQGQLDDNAPVNIDGTINPLAPEAFLDVKAKADGVELTHLSPYSGKYAGYPITKGRLTMDVHYLLDQGTLTADNHLFIDQLTFGDRINGPGISHLPVKLAVALLKNSQGQIDLHIPVTGSLDDPQFSVGSLVWHAFANLIGRAVTSPFRLLASIGGSSHPDLGYVEFTPGSDVLDAAAQARLSELVKLLTNKPTLNLDITGGLDPKFDESGLRQVMVDSLVRQEMQDDRGTNNAGTPTTKLSPDDYARYLNKAYRHAKFPKPRDLIGLTKSQPPEVMQKLLETNMPVDQDALRHLAERRADAVRLWLRGKVDDKRVFVLAPKLDAKGIDDKGKTTRVDFGLH